MYLRLRQIALVAAKLEPVVDLFHDILGLDVCYRDPGIARHGLENALLPVGPVFIEVVAPVQPGTTAERYLERRNGDGGYMFIMDCDNVGARRQRVKELGVRIIAENKKTDWAPLESFQLHPKDTGGAILSIGTHAAGLDLYGGYHWAGPEWQKFVRKEPVKAILGADIQSDDPARLAQRWGEILQRPVTSGADGAPEIRLELGFARFVKDSDGRGEGLSAVHLETTDRATVLAAAQRKGAAVAGNVIDICGTHFVLH